MVSIMDELKQVELLNDDSRLFEKEFKNLKEFYILNSEKELYDFIKIHPGIIILLNKFEPSLKHHFPNAFFELEFNQDLSGNWFDLIMLNIWIDEYTFNNGSADSIRSIRNEFWDLRKKLDLLGELIISKRILR